MRRLAVLRTCRDASHRVVPSSRRRSGRPGRTPALGLFLFDLDLGGSAASWSPADVFRRRGRLRRRRRGRRPDGSPLSARAPTIPLAFSAYLRSKRLTLRRFPPEHAGRRGREAGLGQIGLQRGDVGPPCASRGPAAEPLRRRSGRGQHRRDGEHRKEPARQGTTEYELGQRLTLLFRAPSGLADGLALKESRYAGISGDSPPGGQVGSLGFPVRPAAGPWTIRLGCIIGSAHYTAARCLSRCIVLEIRAVGCRPASLGCPPWPATTPPRRPRRCWAEADPAHRRPRAPRARRGPDRRTRLIDLAGSAPRAAKIDRERPVVFYCRCGGRSAMAAEAFARRASTPTT